MLHRLVNKRAADLFRPLTVKSLTIPNRFAMAPMTRIASPGGVPGADVAAYYARRAAGGVGLIITEGVRIPHPAAARRDQLPVEQQLSRRGRHGADSCVMKSPRSTGGGHSVEGSSS